MKKLFLSALVAVALIAPYSYTRPAKVVTPPDAARCDVSHCT